MLTIKLKKKSFGIATAVFFLASSALATSVTTTMGYFVKLHFSGEAFGKKVAKVMVHTGTVLHTIQEWPQKHESVYWTHLRNVEMARVGDHFFGKTFFVEHEYANSGGSTEIQGIGIQYWVTFADGKTMIMPAGVQQPDQTLSGSDSAEVGRADQDFSSSQDASRTTIVAIYEYLGPRSGDDY